MKLVRWNLQRRASMSARPAAQTDLELLETIRGMIGQNDLDAATNCFLDFARHRGPALRDEAIILTRRWTRISEDRRQVGHSEALDVKENELVKVLLQAITEAGNAVQHEPAPTRVERRLPGRFVDGLLKRGVARLAWGAKRIHGTPAVRCQELRFQYDREDQTSFQLVIDPFELRLGQLTGLVGPNAAGKTTLVRLLAGETSPLAGAVTYPTICESGTDWYTIRQSISYVPQTSQNWHGTVVDNLRFEASAHGYLGPQNDEIVDYFLSRLRLNNYAEHRWDTLSAGYRTRFALARALIADPAILILDEPLAFLDPEAGISFLQDVVGLIRWVDKPIAALVSSQHLYEVESVADQMLFIEAGRVQVRRPASREDRRKCAVFEIRCLLTAGELRHALSDLGSVQVNENLIYCTVTLPDGVTCDEALGMILGRTKVLYFRDISRSTKLTLVR